MTEARKYLAYLLHHLKCRVIWFKKWVILIRTIPVDEPFPTPSAGYILRQAETDDYPAIIAVYPVEFSHHLPEVIKQRQLKQRAKSKARCFVIVDAHGAIKGATWCTPYRNAQIHPKDVDQDGLFEMINTFIVLDARGKGLSESLRRFAIASMASLGYRAAISFVWYSRAGSLKMNLNTGSRVLGEKTLYSILGYRWFRYRPHVSVKKLPIQFTGKVVLLGRDESKLYQSLLELFHFGIPAECVMAPSGNYSRLKFRLLGSRIIDFSAVKERGVLTLPALNCTEKKFLVPVDSAGEQVLVAMENSGLPANVQGLRLSEEQLAVSDSQVSGLPAAVLAAGGVGQYFHEWSVE